MVLSSVTINGAELTYRLEGPENAPLIITLHGGRGFGISSLLSIIEFLLTFDFKAIILGTSKPSHPSQISIASCRTI